MLRRPTAQDRFRDRHQAGTLLGDALVPLFAGVPRERLLVLGLARGGVVVAGEVARILEADLDACVVRKIGSPMQPELAIGAVAPGGVRMFNRQLIAEIGLDTATVERMTARIEVDREALETTLRGPRPLPDLDGKAVILVDDGLATGASMRAAAEYARRSAATVTVATPTAAPDVVRAFEAMGFQTVSLVTSRHFGSVGQWYERFDEVGTAETRAILEHAWDGARG
jgi:putative phosphoribosyl transferase